MRLMLALVMALAGLAAVPILRADDSEYQRQRRLREQEEEQKKYDERLKRYLKEDEERRKRLYGVRYYGAIAYSPRTGQYGYAYNYRTLEGAQQAALRQCNADDAKVVRSAWGGWYCALAVGEDGSYAHAGAPTAAEAKAAALAKCRKLTPRCRIVVCVKSGG